MDAADLAFAGLARQAELIRAGEVSSRELTELYLERIERLDPLLRSYRVVLAEEALAAADEADRRRGDGAPPLNGVPIAIKDDTDMAGQVTARGSLGHGGPPSEDAEVVRRLRAAGTVMLGKTHVPELEAMAATESLAFGATHNPWDLARTCGGSSGGSAAAVAAGLAAAALGTDGAGSIRIPAAAAASSASSPSAGGCRWRTTGTGCRSRARSRAACSTARCSSTPPPSPAPRSPAPRGARPARCGSPTRSRVPRGLTASATTSSATPSSARPSGCATSATRCRSATPTTATSRST